MVNSNPTTPLTIPPVMKDRRFWEELRDFGKRISEHSEEDSKNTEDPSRQQRGK